LRTGATCYQKDEGDEEVRILHDPKVGMMSRLFSR